MTNNVRLIESIKHILKIFLYLEACFKAPKQFVYQVGNGVASATLPPDSPNLETLELVARGAILKIFALQKGEAKASGNWLTCIGYGQDFTCFLNKTQAEAWEIIGRERCELLLRNDLECFEIPFNQWFRAREIYQMSDVKNA